MLLWYQCVRLGTANSGDYIFVRRVVGEAQPIGSRRKEDCRNISSAISWSVAEIARSMPLDKVVTITRAGYTARAIARFKTRQPIVAVTKSPEVKRQLELAYGVCPIHLQYRDDDDRILCTLST